MSSIARGIGSGGSGSRNILVLVYLVVLVVALILIPEIVKYQQGDVPQRAPVANNSATKTGLLSFWEKSRSSLSEKYARLTTRASTPREIQPKGGEKTAELSWARLRSPEYQAMLSAASTEANALARALPPQYSESKFALINFSNGVRFITGNAEKSMSAPEAFLYLARLDLHVREAMARDAVPPSEVAQWNRVSPASALKGKSIAGATGRAARPVAAFAPKISVASIKILHPPTNNGKFIEGGPTTMTLTLSVTNPGDLARIEVYRNGELVTRNMPRVSGKAGKRLYWLRSVDARGIYTLKAVSKSGAQLVRHYSFYDSARRFPWLKRKNGRFDIPFRDFDPKLDRLFLRGAEAESSNGSISFFSSSSGRDLARF